MKNGAWKLLLASLALASLVACETTPEKAPDEGAEGVPVEERTTGPGGEGVESRPMTRPGAFSGHPLDDPASPLYEKVILFAYDSSAIDEQYRLVVEAHTTYLVEHPGAGLILEGHADERGSREYNLALGERRAQAVRRMMMLLGADGGQVGSVSHGEELPAVEGHDESAWRLNRRVEITYRTR